MQLTKRIWLVYLLLATILVGANGCANFTANILEQLGYNKAPAKYAGLKGKKVAIVCGNEKGLSNDAVSVLMTQHMTMHLKQNVKDIKIVGQNTIDNWLDSRGWAETDFQTIGKGVGAERVVCVTVENLKLKQGATLYKGRADVSITVYDIEKDGEVVFRQNLDGMTYPVMTETPAIDTTEAKFRSMYVGIVAKHLAPLFYDHDPKELYGLDAKSSSF